MPRTRIDIDEIGNVGDESATIDDTIDSGSSTGSNGDNSGGNSGSSDDGSSIGSNGTEPGSIFGANGTGDGDNGDEDDRIIRDEAGNPTYSPTGRIRKRRASSGSRTTAATSSSSKGKKVPVDALARILMMGHMMVGNLLHAPEIPINENEGKIIATPLSELLILYDVKPDPRILTMMELGAALSYVWGPRIVIMRERMKAEKAERDLRRSQQRNQVATTEEAIFSPSMAANVPFDANGLN